MANTSALQNVDWALESPHDYLLKLTKKCDSIDLEIIDFLVKWEDGEENDTNSNHHHHHNGGISSYQLRNIGVDAIDNVDKELKTVDDWIGEQILKLDTTKARLKVIEIESNALETCFTNLANTKEIITFIQQKLSIKESEEKLLKDPNAIFENILQASIPTKIMKREIGKLVDAISNLQYSLKYFDSPSEAYAGIAQLASNTIEANAVTLEQIRSLTFVTQQTTVLGKLCQKLCKRLAELLPSFFDDLFRHQFLTDYFLNGQTMKVRNFDLVTYSQSIMKLKKQPIDIDFANMISTNLASEMLFQLKFAFRAHDFVQFDVSTMKSVQANDGLSSQRVFHDLINSLLPILKKFQDLDRQSYQNTFIKYYVELSQTRIYKPILKAIFRKLKEKLASKATVCNFQSVCHYSLKNSSSLPLVLVPSSHQGISPWIAFGAALSIVIPLIQNEREVLSKVLFTKNIDKFGVADQDADSSEDESLDQGNEETQSDPNVDEEQQVIRLDKCCDTVFEYVTGMLLLYLPVSLLLLRVA